MSDDTVMDGVWKILHDGVFTRPSTDRLFNLYRDRDADLDIPDAPAIRRANLRSYLDAYEARPGVFLLVEAPGPWGARFSGVPITSEAQLLDSNFPIDGRRTSLAEEPHEEYSANIFWRVLTPHFPAFFTWNTVPFHPHDEDDSLSIRTPTAREIDSFEEVTGRMLDLLRPSRVAAVGRKAERALKRLGVDHVYVRHPSQGGAKQFEVGVLRLFEQAGAA